MPIVSGVGVSSIDDRTCCTLSAAVPVTPSADAWIVVLPLAFESTCERVANAESISATDPFVVPHVNVTPVIGASRVSRASARIGRRMPSDGSAVLSVTGTPAESRPTMMRVIGVSTVTLATPVIAPDVARTCVPPRESAVTRPLALTVAVAGASVDHVIAAVIGLPRPSTADAANW